MIGTRLKEQCGKGKKFKTLKELAKCIGISPNMFYLTLQNKKSMSLKSLHSLVYNTGVSSNYYLGITSVKPISFTGPNEKVPFKYELNSSFLCSDLNEQICTIVIKIREIESRSNKDLEPQLEYIDSLKPNKKIFNGERLKVVMEATGYTSTSLAKILNCTKSTVDGWINKNTFPNIHNFEKIVYILQCSGDFLLNITNDPNIRWDNHDNIINNQGISYNWTKIIYALYGEHLKEF